MIDREIFASIIINRFNTQYLEDHPNLIATIYKVINDEPRYTKKLVKNYKHFCMKCGECCIWEECNDLIDGHCTIYSKRPRVCKDYPRWDTMDGRQGLVPDTDCEYAKQIIINEVVKEIDSMSKLD